MQMTNGVLKKGLQHPVMPVGAKGNVVIESEADLDEMDLSAFLVTGNQRKDGQIRPSDSTAKTSEAEKFLAESEALYLLGAKYETEVVARGHQALYELLASIYSLALRIEDNPAQEKILSLIRSNLKEKFDIKLNKNTSAIGSIVRFVVRTDKMSASRYSKVLEVARQENLSAQELPAYIARRGGVSQIQETEAKYLAKKEGSKNNKERTALIREFLQLQGLGSKTDLKYDGEVTVFNEDKDTASETSSFCFFMAHYDGDNNYQIISANDFGKTFEDNIVKFIGKAMPNDLYVLERGIRNYKKKLMMDESLPSSLREALRSQLAAPMKYAKTQVIEMEQPVEVDSEEG